MEEKERIQKYKKLEKFDINSEKLKKDEVEYKRKKRKKEQEKNRH